MRAVSTAFVRLVPLLCLALAACGGASSGEGTATEATPMRPEEAVVGDLVEKKDEVPAAIDAATQQHLDDARRAVDEAESGKSDEPAR